MKTGIKSYISTDTATIPLEKGVVVHGSKPKLAERACMGCCFQLSAMDSDHRLVSFDGMDVLRSAGCRAAAYRVVPEEGIFYKVIYVNANIE